MPNIAARLDGTLPLVVDGSLNAQQNLFRGSNLIRSHHQELLIHVEHTVFGQYVQDGMLGKETGGEISQIYQPVVLLVSPIRGKLKGVTIGFMFLESTCILLLLIVASGVTIVFRFSTIRDDKDLNEVEHGFTCPEAITQVTVNLVECLFDGHTPAFQFNMNHW